MWSSGIVRIGCSYAAMGLLLLFAKGICQIVGQGEDLHRACLKLVDAALGEPKTTSRWC